MTTESLPIQRPPYPMIAPCIAGRSAGDANLGLQDVIDPATAQVLGSFLPSAETDWLSALTTAQAGFDLWRRTPAYERGSKLRRAADLLRTRATSLAGLITLEAGKPWRESLTEVQRAAEALEWAAEEGRRVYGRTVPPRQAGMRVTVERVPLGPVLGVTSWNAPLSTPARKVAGALGAGCSIALKVSEHTPATGLGLLQCLLDADIPSQVVSVLFGNPVHTVNALLGSGVIKAVTFTGSIGGGLSVAAQAARVMARTVMELGGHAPVIVCPDADVSSVAQAAVRAKFRGTGQICVAPTRFYVHDAVFDHFAEAFVQATRALRPGSGFDPTSTVGPLINAQRVAVMEGLVEQDVQSGGQVLAGGQRLTGPGYFFEPTVVADMAEDSDAMTREPFGPLALMARFTRLDDAIARANRLPYGLAAYAFTHDSRQQALLRDTLSVGVLSINHLQTSWAETPFGGAKDSGMGSEGGVEGFQAFQQIRLVSELG